MDTACTGADDGSDKADSGSRDGDISQETDRQKLSISKAVAILVRVTDEHGDVPNLAHIVIKENTKELSA